MTIKDKVIVITGASSGLGKSLAEALALKKARLVLSSHKSDELNATAAVARALPVVADVRNDEQVKNLAAQTVMEFDRIDVWVNNAGIWTPHSPVLEQDIERLHEMMEVNFFGLVYGSRAALAQMRKQGGGTIVQVISIRALDPRPDESGYVASKFAADGFTKCLRLETKNENISVLAVYPAGMQTNLFAEKVPDNYADYMKPETVAALIVENLEKDAPEEELVIRRGAK